MNKLMAALLIAAAAMPSLADAQDGRGGEHEHRGQSGRPGSQPAAQPQRAPAPTFQQRPAGAPPRFNGGQPFAGGRPQAYQAQPAGDPRRFGGGQPFAGQPRPMPQAGYGRQFDPRGGQAEGYQRGPDPVYRGDPNRSPFRNDGYRSGGAQPFAGGSRGGGYGYRPDYNRNGGQWNRGWRNDQRFDWGSYRRYNSELFRLPRYSAPYGYGYGYQRFGIGVVIEEQLFAPDYWIDDPYAYRLPPVDGPFRWVRYYNDALLIDMESGEVVDVVYGIFY